MEGGLSLGQVMAKWRKILPLRNRGLMGEPGKVACSKMKSQIPSGDIERSSRLKVGRVVIGYRNPLKGIPCLADLKGLAEANISPGLKQVAIHCATPDPIGKPKKAFSD